jgi:uncharacterized protein YegL
MFCSPERLSLFLDRVKLFPSCRFVMANAEQLESSGLEVLLSFFSDRRISLLGINLHCILRGDSLLHTTPWLREVSWDGDSISAPSDLWEINLRKAFPLVVVSSQACGTGKTRLIRQELDSLKSQGAHVVAIVVHEMSSLRSLVEALKCEIRNIDCWLALYISFTFMPSRSAQTTKWLDDVNHFLFSLFALRMVYDPASATSLTLPRGKCNVFIEMPSAPSGGSADEWLKSHAAIVDVFATYRSPVEQFVIDEKARRVCTYLRAFSDGTINRKFEGGARKRIVLVLDCSGSMDGRPFQDAISNAAGIIESHVVPDDVSCFTCRYIHGCRATGCSVVFVLQEFGVFLFDHRVHAPIPIHAVRDTSDLVFRVRQLHCSGGGTSMYNALNATLHSVTSSFTSMETWIICLTDGVSDVVNFEGFRNALMGSPRDVHLVTIGINLHPRYEQNLRQVCTKFATSTNADESKGFFVRADGTTAGMDEAFGVVKSKIPVSQTFQLDGELSDDDCRRYMATFLPFFVEPHDMLLQSFWVNFLYRRTQVFDNNEEFNYNEKHKALGSSLMDVMFSEVERLISENQRRDWLLTNHAQLIYDFTEPKSPQFRLICTAPERLDGDLRKKLSNLDLPGFHIPTNAELGSRAILDRYLSQALEIPLQRRADGSEGLLCIDDCGFILTVDFTMKLLNIHERVACSVPCLIEGETGVSKTALTKMYSILRNSSLVEKARMSTSNDLEDIVRQLENGNEGNVGDTSCSISERLRQTIQSNNEVAKRVLEALDEKISRRSAVFVSVTPGTEPAESTQLALKALEQFVSSALHKTFFEINVDASLTEKDFVDIFDEIRATAEVLRGTEATIVVFLDGECHYVSMSRDDSSLTQSLFQKSIRRPS